MTLLPHDNRNVVGMNLADLPKPARTLKVGPECSNPSCERWADHAHHIWRRSFLGGDYHYVRLWNGAVVANLTSLCWQCHDLVTQGKARIVLNDSGLTFYWRDDDNNYSSGVDPLRYQPPRLDVAGTDHSPEHRVSTGDVEVEAGTPAQLTVEGGEVPWDSVHLHLEDEPETCPSCGRVKRRKPKEELPPGEVRPKKSWTIAVPVDHREDGYALLDSLLLSCAEALGRDEHKSWRYYTLVELLAWANQHLHLLERDAA